ncbi:Glutathione-regulated potassium-efflux system protein KefB [subsurface metagenome]
MGRIPGFTAHIFPTVSMPGFSLVANIGLVLFLFLVGLEVDLRFLVSNWKIALSVGAAGMALPFGMGVGIAYGLFHQFRSESGIQPIGFGIYALFIGVALSITAFPVLCRILTSLKLLSTPVGVIVLSAGVGNDVVGWILLALCVALVNSGAGLTALWILLCAVGYCLLLVYGIRPAFVWVLRRTKSLENGPTQGVVALTLLLVLASSFFTNIIGIHAIFGAFMVGLICPHEGGFAIKLTEKIEDLVSTLFLPLYFALSGLNTNLGLLDNGITWGYVVGVTAIAFAGKIAGGTLASRLNGLVWRESLTIGCLMSCKGLVELIVLNIGLQARILSTRTFTIFVVMALVTTFATTPLVSWLYPPWYQEKLELWKKGKINWDGTPVTHSDGGDSTEDPEIDAASRILVYLRTDGLSSLFSIVSLLTGSRHSPRNMDSRVNVADKKIGTSEDLPLQFQRPLRIHGLRLMELTERNSSVMKVSELEEYATRDPIIKAFGSSAYGAARDVTMSGQIAVVPDHSYAGTLVQRATNSRSHLILLPWSETGSISEIPSSFDHAPLGANVDPLANRDFATLVSNVFEDAQNVCAVGVFVDKSLLKVGVNAQDVSQANSPVMERATRQLSRTLTGISLPDIHESSGLLFKSSDSHGRPQVRVLYTGETDDLFAVKLALQLAKNGGVDVRIVSVSISDASKSASSRHRDNHIELRNIQSNLPDMIKTHTTFEEQSAATYTDSAVLDSLLVNQANESGDVTVLVGRGLVSSTNVGNAGSSSMGAAAQHATLGSITKALVVRMKETKVTASLLVVQGKVSSKMQEERRGKGMGYSQDTVTTT